MASVPLRFIPPIEDNYESLLIYEAPAKDGPFTLIETVPAGTYPNYIDHYTTTHATSATDWFAIEWVDVDGGKTDLSSPLQGGTESLTGVLVSRMLLRDPSLNENIAAQEAEAAICDYYGVFDPNTIDPETVSPKILSGLTALALAWSYVITTSVSSSAQKWVAGLISLDLGSSATKSTANIDALMKQANSLLQRNYSRIMRLKEIEVAGGYTQIVAVDLSRTIVEIA